MRGEWGPHPRARRPGRGYTLIMVFDAQSAIAAGPAVLGLKSWPSGARYWFDHADYDAETDRLHLTFGPPTAARAYPTPEGHVVRVAAHGRDLCGLVITDLHRRLARRGRIDLTLQDNERLSLSVTDVARALTAR